MAPDERKTAQLSGAALAPGGVFVPNGAAERRRESVATRQGGFAVGHARAV